MSKFVLYCDLIVVTKGLITYSYIVISRSPMFTYSRALLIALYKTRIHETSLKSWYFLIPHFQRYPGPSGSLKGTVA
jgi:hypothetical protein